MPGSATGRAPRRVRPLKLTKAFRAVSRRGRWAHSPRLSVGALRNNQPDLRVGLRAGRAVGGAVRRNRAKRRLRAAILSEQTALRAGVDLVIVLRSPALPAPATALQRELNRLCERVGATRRNL